MSDQKRHHIASRNRGDWHFPFQRRTSCREQAYRAAFAAMRTLGFSLGLTSALVLAACGASQASPQYCEPPPSHHGGQRTTVEATADAAPSAGAERSDAEVRYCEPEQGTTQTGDTQETRDPILDQPQSTTDDTVTLLNQLAAHDADLTALGAFTASECDEAETLKDNICRLAERICNLEEGARCEDGRARCESAEARISQQCD